MNGAPDPGTCVLLDPSSSALAVLPGAVRTRSADELRAVLSARAGVRTVVLGPDLDMGSVVGVLARHRVSSPGVAFVLERRHVRHDVLQQAREAGVRDVVSVGDLGALAAAVARPLEDDDGPSGTARPGPSPDRRPAPPDTPARRGRVTTVFAAKGGCGTTTFCTNLAAALADDGRRSVVLVDLDVAHGDVAISLDLTASSSLADLTDLTDLTDLAAHAAHVDGAPDGPGATAPLRYEQLQTLLTPHSPGLSALLSPGLPGRVSVPPALFRSALDLLVEHVDHVVVDTPTSVDGLVVEAFDRADVVVLLATLEIPALKHLTLTMDALRQLEVSEDQWRVVLNRSDSQVGLAVREVERTLGRSISAHLPSSRDVPASVNAGVPLVLRAPRHPVSVAVRAFAEREVAGTGAVPPVVDLRDVWPAAMADRAGSSPGAGRDVHRRAGRPAPH